MESGPRRDRRHGGHPVRRPARLLRLGRGRHHHGRLGPRPLHGRLAALPRDRHAIPAVGGRGAVRLHPADVPPSTAVAVADGAVLVPARRPVVRRPAGPRRRGHRRLAAVAAGLGARRAVPALAANLGHDRDRQHRHVGRGVRRPGPALRLLRTVRAHQAVARAARAGRVPAALMVAGCRRGDRPLDPLRAALVRLDPGRAQRSRRTPLFRPGHPWRDLSPLRLDGSTTRGRG